MVPPTNERPDGESDPAPELTDEDVDRMYADWIHELAADELLRAARERRAREPR